MSALAVRALAAVLLVATLIRGGEALSFDRHFIYYPLRELSPSRSGC